jgi:murein DD-endopeptidase MepM/ murein hydrolase activator NlpD
VPAATPATARPTHVVARGDALYGVARQYGVSPKELALANQLEPDAYLMPGQELVIPAAGAVETAPAETVVAEAVVVETPAPVAEAASPDAAFVWPVDGKVIAMFGEEDDGETRSGIAIEARKGAPVKAARDGVVVYAGDAIRGYGRMILLRHDDGYVTAYGHNSAILVNVGDTVEQGQVIARVGDTGGVATPQLHFEVRQGKQPIDPTTVLTARPTAVAQSTG